jgi:hypothetical protein
VLKRKEVKRYIWFVLETTEVYWPSVLTLQTCYLRLFLWWLWIVIYWGLHPLSILDYRVVPYSFRVRGLCLYSVALAGWVSYCYYYLNLTGYVTFNTASYLEDADVVPTVHWIYSPPVHIVIMCTVQFVVYLRTKDRGMISSIRLFCSIHILVTYYSVKSLFY